MSELSKEEISKLKKRLHDLENFVRRVARFTELPVVLKRAAQQHLKKEIDETKDDE